MSEEDWLPIDRHCGRAGCTCTHLYCDRGFDYARPRRVTIPLPGGKTKEVEFERVRPCANCKPEAYEAMLRGRDRKDFLRRLRSLRPGKDTGRQEPTL